MIFALLTAEGTVENLIEWDGVTPWLPPEGLTVTKVQEGDTAAIGESFVPALTGEIPASSNE